MSRSDAVDSRTGRRNVRSAVLAFSIAAGMLALGFASVPLYNIFCRVTGFGGTTQQASAAQADGIQVSGKTISIRFDANTSPALPWRFKPDQVTQKIHIGERDMATFVAKNLSSKPVTGRASYNVTPVSAGAYFAKIQCFCFTEQRLEPGQEVHMPVLFYVDPAILDDPETKDINEITLSYTFHPMDPA